MSTGQGELAQHPVCSCGIFPPESKSVYKMDEPFGKHKDTRITTQTLTVTPVLRFLRSKPVAMFSSACLYFSLDWGVCTCCSFPPKLKGPVHSFGGCFPEFSSLVLLYLI